MPPSLPLRSPLPSASISAASLPRPSLTPLLAAPCLALDRRGALSTGACSTSFAPALPLLPGVQQQQRRRRGGLQPVQALPDYVVERKFRHVSTTYNLLSFHSLNQDAVTTRAAQLSLIPPSCLCSPLVLSSPTRRPPPHLPSHPPQVCDNKRATFDFELLDRYEAGVELQGTEVKSICNGQVSLQEAFCRVLGGELYLLNCYVGKHPAANNYDQHEVRRDSTCLSFFFCSHDFL
jgi:hypothetical protein